VLSSAVRPPLTLHGRHIDLVPLEREHAAALASAAWDPEVDRLLRRPLGRTEASLRARIDETLAVQSTGVLLSFATVLRATGRPIGVTNFAHIDPPNRSLEIGGTWLDSRYWRTPVNTDAKRLLLGHAFEVAHAHRVWLQTDRRNERSQRAIARIGAVRETERREDVLLAGGFYRTSVIFSLLESEWPQAKARLDAALLRSWDPASVPPAIAPPPALGSPPRPETPDIPPLPDTSFRPPIELRGRHVRLVPLERSLLPALVEAGRDPAVWTYMRIRHGDSPEGMSALVEDLLRLQAHGEVLAFAVRVLPSDRVAGITRFLDIDRPNRLTEVGTWIDTAYWRTPVNTELKLLMFRHAFETERVHRLELRTDVLNANSQRAIERLGARPEGALRDHYLLASGRYRTSRYYSILENEWPDVRARLEGFLARPWPVPGG
jgi:N-acetyltransferase